MPSRRAFYVLATAFDSSPSEGESRFLTLRVAKAGILSTLQGLGRSGYARFGVNPGGAMDTAALRLLNVLLGNKEAEAAVEMHFPAGEFEAEATCVAALGGADFGAILNGRPVERWKALSLREGDSLRFTGKETGSRAYLAIAGGFEADEWLGSKSTNLVAGIGGMAGRALRSGDVLAMGLACRHINLSRSIAASLIPKYSSFPTVRITEGPEFELLDCESKIELEQGKFTLSRESNRMGFRLSGPELRLVGPYEVTSSPVTFGTLQLIPSGQMIALMADHQTSGGYPRVANIITRDLPVAAQLSAGDRVAFRLVPIAEAAALLRSFERDISFLRAGCMG